MTILYIATERSDAQGAATALRGIAPNVTVLWASHFDHAMGWIHENRDLAAVVVDNVQIDGPACASFLKHLNTLGLKAPVVVVAPEEAAARLGSLGAGVYDFVAKNDSVFLNLPVVVTRAIERAREGGDPRGGPPAQQPLDAAFDRLYHNEYRVKGPGGHERVGPGTMSGTLVAPDAVAASTVERRLGELEASLRQAEERQAFAQTTAAAPAAFDGIARHENAAVASLEHELAQAEAALREAEQRHLSAMMTAAEQLAESRAQHEASLARVAATKEMVDEQLREATAEVERARQDQAAAASDADRLSRRESELLVRLAELTVSLSELQSRVADAETALAAANDQAARDRRTAADEAAGRQAELQAQLAQEAEKRGRAEDSLARALTSRDEAEERHAAALSTTAALLAERQSQFDAQLAEAASARAALASQAQEVETALTRARQDLESRAADIDRLTKREAELVSNLGDATAIRAALEHRLARIETTVKETDERVTRERLAAARKAAAREAELEVLLREERETRSGLEQKLAQVEAALGDAERRHASAMAEIADAAATRAALERRLNDVEGELSETVAARDSIRRQLGDAETAVEQARRDHASATAEIERRTQREADLASQLADAAATRSTLERELSDARAALKEAEERGAREQAGAAGRQADLEARLTLETKKRETLTAELAEARSAAADAERWFREETAAAAARAQEAAARYEEQIARERREHEERLAEAQEQLRTLGLERDGLAESLATLRERSQRLDVEHREERESLDRARLAAKAEIGRVAAEQAQTQRDLEEARRSAQETLDRVSIEHASALARLADAVSERDARIQEQEARHSSSLQAAAAERAALEEDFRKTLAARHREIEQLQTGLETTIHELDATRSRRDVLQAEADRVPQLQARLDESRADNRRQFELSPVALCRCTRGGTLTHINGALAVLVGYRTADQVNIADFVTTVFESPDDLSWLIERCSSTNAAESVETTWRRGNGERRLVRLSASASGADVIEIVAEDLTDIRALQDRLGRAQRMEAVGRLASEVAVTCGTLLQDIHRHAEGWLATVGDDTALRHQGERLREEVTRAANFLRLLDAYSAEETSALAPVELNAVLRDLEPVLKRVAGDGVELEVHKTSSPFVVDVKAEHVERLLVNLAGYSRERMPSGGVLRIDIAQVVVDRRFIARYPNVRQGPHALITVTAARRTAQPTLPPPPGDGAAEPGPSPLAADRPGVDLGALQTLIGACSGHLWMTIEPPGDMVVKIRLPLSAPDDRTRVQTSVARSSRGNALARKLRP